MHFIPSFSGRTRGPAGAFFVAAIRPERASFSRRAAGGCPNLSAPALPPSAEHGTGFGTTASFHCCAVLTQLPVTTRRKQCGKRAHQPGFQRFPATASRSGLFRNRPFSPCNVPAPLFPRKNFRASVPLRGIRPEVTPKHAPCPQTHRPVLHQEAAPGSPHYGTS